MKYNIPLPVINNKREQLSTYSLHRGKVVAFRSWFYSKPQTGIIVMEDHEMMLAAYNLYDENEDNMWYMDVIPDNNIELYEANENEKIWGYKFFLDYVYGNEHVEGGKNPFIAFIEDECPHDDHDWKREELCQDLLSLVPKMLDKSEWEGLKQQLWHAIQQSGGLQYNRFCTEYYCFLIGTLMIAENSTSSFIFDSRINKLKKEWYQFSWMYGMAIGRLTGTGYNNFTAVVKQAGQNRRMHYLHLYLPLVENNIDKICRYNNAENKYRLQEAIRKMRDVEALHEQKTDLDDLYHILFPKHFVYAMSSSRPAATIAGLKEEVAAKEMRIKELENAVDDLTNRYNKVLGQLAEAVKDLEADKITSDDLEAAFLRFPAELALTFFGNMSTLFALNPTWQKYAPQIQSKILAKQKEQQDKQQKMGEALMKKLEEPTTQNNYNIELIQKKETNIETNYGANIEQNGGLIALPKIEK
ncbi:MAG: hypothetical protein IJR07_10405 [Bacteroidaceae bacterium]|nr:hypothetical protein [Bacteroidaceae bacterium]